MSNNLTPFASLKSSVGRAERPAALVLLWQNSEVSLSNSAISHFPILILNPKIARRSGSLKTCMMLLAIPISLQNWRFRLSYFEYQLAAKVTGFTDLMRCTSIRQGVFFDLGNMNCTICHQFDNSLQVLTVSANGRSQ